MKIVCSLKRKFLPEFSRGPIRSCLMEEGLSWCSLFFLAFKFTGRSIFIIPKKELKDIYKVLRAFLRSGPELKASGAKIAWDYVCSPKAKGGLGFMHLSTWNKAAMSRHIWGGCGSE